MKTISKHLAEVILAVVTVALIVGVVLCFTTPIGNVISGILQKENQVATGDIWRPGSYNPGVDDPAQETAGLFRDGELIVPWSELLSTGTVKVEDGAVSCGMVLPDDAPAMNEYGFYFGVPYSISDSGIKLTLTFFENGAVETAYFMNGELLQSGSIPEGSVSYSTGSVDMTASGMDVYTFSADGTSVTIDGMDLVCGEPADLPGDLIMPTDGSVTAVADNAFQGCTGLTGIEIPDSVISIGNNAFKDCTSLETMTVPFVGASANGTENTHFGYIFGAASYSNQSNSVPASLKTVIVAGGETINDNAFANCENLENIEISDSVTSIGVNAFAGCTGLSSATFYDAEGWYVTKTQGATGGLAVTLTNAATNAEHLTTTYSGHYWYKAESASYVVEIETNMDDVGTATFTGEYDGLTSINLIGECDITMKAVATKTGMAFAGWYSDDTLLSSNAEYTHTFTGEQTIEARFDLYYVDLWITSSNRATIGYTGETGENLVIPEKFQADDGTLYKVKGISAKAFYGCTGLASITIPTSVTAIDGKAFEGCRSLKTVYYEGTLDQWCNLGFTNEYSNPCCNGANLYINDELVTDIVIPSTFTTIQKYAFYNCRSLASLEIPAGVTTIDAYAFSGCRNLASVTIPDSVTTIGEYAFSGCTGLTSVTIPDSVTTIGQGAFKACTSLGTVTFGENSRLTELSRELFAGCDALESIEIPDGVTVIGYDAFYSCSLLTYVTIPDGVTTIDGRAFMYTNLSDIVIPDSVTDIRGQAFYGYSGNAYYKGTLEQWCGIAFTDDYANPNYQGTVYIDGVELGDDIVIPQTITKIKPCTFLGAPITSVTLHDGVTSIGKGAFALTELTSVKIPAGETVIAESAFYGCTNLKSVEIPASVTGISASAFYGCKKLTAITFNGTVEQWNAFGLGHIWNYDCPAITVTCTDGTVTVPAYFS